MVLDGGSVQVMYIVPKSFIARNLHLFIILKHFRHFRTLKGTGSKWKLFTGSGNGTELIPNLASEFGMDGKMEWDREEWLTSMKFVSPDSNDEIDLDEFEPGPIIRQLISDKIGPQVEKTIDDMFYIKLREKVLKIMPRHWVKRIVDIVTFQVGQ